ncbi:MAG TPA: gamma-glutamylcyclotransferase family protein [Terracidiphilus sp.]|nr:gamma-glutamylcyclotransferase family protein [Terracidiphilus sp.]
MSEYLFSYGTLQPGRAPAEIAPAAARLRQAGAGWIRARLYDFGRYPGAILDEDESAEIEGVVFELPDDADFLRQLDVYEEFSPGAPEDSLFVRELHPVRLDSGGTLMCWIYLYNRDPAGAREARSRQDR